MYSNKLVTKQQIRGRRWLLKRLALKHSKQEAIAMAMVAAVMDELGGTGHCCWAWPAVQGYDRMRIDAAGRQSLFGFAWVHLRSVRPSIADCR